MLVRVCRPGPLSRGQGYEMALKAWCGCYSVLEPSEPCCYYYSELLAPEPSLHWQTHCYLPHGPAPDLEIPKCPVPAGESQASLVCCSPLLEPADQQQKPSAVATGKPGHRLFCCQC